MVLNVSNAHKANCMPMVDVTVQLVLSLMVLNVPPKPLTSVLESPTPTGMELIVSASQDSPQMATLAIVMVSLWAIIVNDVPPSPTQYSPMESANVTMVMSILMELVL